MGEARRWTPLLGNCVWERYDGLRFHTGGLVTLQGEHPRQWSPMAPNPEVKRHRRWIHALERAYPTDECWRCDTLWPSGAVDGWTRRIPVTICTDTADRDPGALAMELAPVQPGWVW